VKHNVNVEELEWQPHKTVKSVEIKIGRGLEVPEHIHEDSDDILYPLSGKAKMWVEGSGEFSLEPGVIVRVPQGTKHRIYDVSEDLLIYDVFWPALL